jgi:hypothetical protein
MPLSDYDVTTFLTTTGDAVREVYHDMFKQMHSRFGGKTNRLFQPSKRKIDGDGINIQVQDSNAYPARFDTDVNPTFPTPRTFGADTYKVTLSETASDNDFSTIAGSVSVTHLDIKRKYTKESAATEFVNKTVSELLAHVGETTALHRHIGRSARVGLVNTAAPTQNDARLFASCSATPGVGTGVRFPVDTGSIAAFPRGLLLDNHDATTGAKTVTLWVTDYNPRDKSVGAWGVDSDGNPDSSVDLTDLVGDNDVLYISGEKNKGLYSIGEWFAEPGDSDDFFGQDRADADNRWLLPHKSGPTSATAFHPRYLDDLCIELGYIDEDPDGGYVALTTPELEQAFRDAVGQDTIIPYPTNAQKGKLLAQYGFDGNMFRHPTIGRIMLQADQFATPQKIRFLRVGDWETLYAADNGFEFLPGDTGGWYRQQAPDDSGRSTVYRMDGLCYMVDICLDPRRQAEIENVTS